MTLCINIPRFIPTYRIMYGDRISYYNERNLFEEIRATFETLGLDEISFLDTNRNVYLCITGNNWEQIPIICFHLYEYAPQVIRISWTPLYGRGITRYDNGRLNEFTCHETELLLALITLWRETLILRHILVKISKKDKERLSYHERKFSLQHCTMISTNKMKSLLELARNFVINTLHINLDTQLNMQLVLDQWPKNELEPGYFYYIKGRSKDYDEFRSRTIFGKAPCDYRWTKLAFQTWNELHENRKKQGKDKYYKGFKLTINTPSCKNRKPIPIKIRQLIFRKHNYSCANCGRTTSEDIILEVDHIIPVSKGGTNDLSNLQALCDKCNRIKAANIE